MRHSSSSRRSRNRNNNKRNNKSRVFDSNGPDVRIRGTAHQVSEKYMALAKDATGAGDHILAESYLQHAEHYQRFISGWVDAIDEYTRTGSLPESYTNTSSDQAKPQQQQQKSSQKTEGHKAQSGNRKDHGNDKDTKNEDLGLPKSIVGEKVDELTDA